jgi:hypothetical protein
VRALKKRNANWAGAIGIAVVLFAAGLSLIILGRKHVIPASPWREIGVALACLSALVGLGRAFAEADVVSGETGTHDETDR